MSQDPLLTKGELGPYRIEKKLGQGAMGGVYLGFHRVLEVYHAIKVISPKLVGDETAVERFLREARNTARLKHMNIVQVVGADEVNGTYYLAMEYVQGQTLEQLLRGDGLNLHDSVRYIHMVANALHYAHTRGVIHRDIKPANLMVNEEDIAKLMDFGLVRDLEPDQDAAEQLTMAGYIMGTPQYMPLEQWEGHGVDLRSDVYALGATLYVMLTGKLPFPGKNAREIFRNVLTGEFRNPSEHNPEIDDELSAIITKAMAPDMDDRYQSAEELALELENWWDTHPYQGTSLFMAPVMEDTRMARGASTGSRSATRAQLTHGSTVEGSTPTGLDFETGRRLPLVIAVVLLVVIAGAGGAYLVMGGDAEGNTAPDTESPALTLGFETGVGTESAPLAVNRAEFSIPGSSTGEVTVNGTAYEFGSALQLEPGVNRLNIAARQGDESATRTLFVLLDQTPPTIEFPPLAQSFGNIIPTAGASFPLKGSVSDEGAGLRGLNATIRVNGDTRELPLRGGEFELDLPVNADEIVVEIDARDAAGNRSDTLTFRVVPDRTEPAFLDDWLPADGYTMDVGFLFGGQLNKSRGVTLKINDRDVDMSSDGSFGVDVRVEPGEYEFDVVAKDWLGREVATTRTVVVDPTPPVLRVTEPDAETIRVSELPWEFAVAGNLDDPRATLEVNGREISRRDDGSFSAAVAVSEYGPVRVRVVATDPGGRVASKEISFDVKRLLYKLIGTNEQGRNEYERLTDGMTMVEIPGGGFTRGSDDELPDAPSVEVEISSFLIAKYETTNAQFAKFLNAAGVTGDEAVSRRWLVKAADGFFRGLQVAEQDWSSAPGEESRPVVNVTWLGAQAYCEWADPAGGALPGEAQWEYAARGTDGRTYPWGDEPVSTARANTGVTGRDAVTDVTKQSAGESPFGVRNMSGNVEEWCRDWYEEGAYLRPDQQGEDPALTTRPNAVDHRVVRGGSFLSPFMREPEITDDDEPGALHAFARSRRLPNTGAKDRGFRPVGKLPAD